MIRALARLSSTTLFALFVGVVVIVVIAFLVVGGGVDLGTSDDNEGALGASEQVQEDASGAVSSDEATSEAPLSTGSASQQDVAFQFGDLLLAVTDIRVSRLVSEGVDEVEAIERFATVLLTVRNTGDAPLSLNEQLQLLDDQGRAFSPDAEATAAVAVRDGSANDALVARLQPDLEIELVVVFQVPEGAENFRLRVRGGYVDVVLER